LTQQIEIDPDLVIEKPPFNSGVERFEKLKKEKKGFVPLELKEKEILKKRNKEMIRQNKYGFNKEAERFRKK